MCGRYLIDDEAYADIWELLNNPLFSKDFLLQTVAKGEVFPTNLAPVYTKEGVAAVKWGFPHWQNAGEVIINARSETALDKNMFKRPLRERRCVVPSNGFFEWHRVAGQKKKDKYLFKHHDDDKLYMAGIFNTFREPSGAEYNAFVILTTDASDSVARIHNRMPLILKEDEREYWLNDDIFMELVLRRPGPELLSEAA